MLKNPFKLFYKVLKRISKLFSRQNQYKWLMHEINRINIIAKRQRVLNIGAGGEIAKRISKLENAEITSLDCGEKKKPDVIADARDMYMFDKNSFDIVFLMDVIEHIPEPHKAISEVFRVLKKGGTLVLSAPFIFPIHDAPHDYFRFTRFGLSHLLRNFEDIEIREKNDYIHSQFVITARMLVTETKRSIFGGCLLFLSALIVYPIIFIIAKLIDSNYSTTGYFIVARK